MSRIPETGRLAGHTLIDALSARDETASLAEREAATELALERLRDIDAISVRLDETTGRIDIDVSAVISPALMAITWLASRLSEATGESPLEIWTALREHFDRP
ncbi:hypothetical protein A0130_09870 [Leifsonia xyli]|uniref:hypothetical protein n=1 Tax=Leifsonia xyli TaxID=1575 RepID=UPI0007CDC78A|nr:hypothetical protein A0130_09870 [Leifsonia xyli]